MSCKAGCRQFVTMFVPVGKMLIHQIQGQLGPSRHYIHYTEKHLLAANKVSCARAQYVDNELLENISAQAFWVHKDLVALFDPRKSMNAVLQCFWLFCWCKRGAVSMHILVARPDFQLDISLLYLLHVFLLVWDICIIQVQYVMGWYLRSALSHLVSSFRSVQAQWRIAQFNAESLALTLRGGISIHWLSPQRCPKIWKQNNKKHINTKTWFLHVSSRHHENWFVFFFESLWSCSFFLQRC